MATTCSQGKQAEAAASSSPSTPPNLPVKQEEGATAGKTTRSGGSSSTAAPTTTTTPSGTNNKTRSRKVRSRLAGAKELPPEVLQHYNNPIVTCEERVLEGRKVHRVREYWLEYEAMEHFQTMQDFTIPLALFEARMREANKNNSRFIDGSIDESARVFFREFLDDKGVLCLKIKLSEKLHYNKPSKNILKRWNLSNGMLYFFYSIIGRSQPPSSEEILLPFYHQKRIDFINKVCLVPPKDSGSHASRKRRRDGDEPILSPSELEVEAPKEPHALFRNLQMFLGSETISEASVKHAIEGGVWEWHVEYEEEAESGNENEEDEEDLMNRRARAVWAPQLEKVEEWGFENGALQVFTRACRLNWSTIKPVWDAWNDDLGNNSIEWEALWGSKKGTMVKEEEELAAMDESNANLEEELYYLDHNTPFDDEIVILPPPMVHTPYYDATEEYYPVPIPISIREEDEEEDGKEQEEEEAWRNKPGYTI